MTNVGLYISIYAAIISTLVFGWRLYEFRTEHRKRLSITNGIITQIPIYHSQFLGESEVYFVTTIINIGKTKLLIERPSFLTNIEINNNNQFSFVNLREPTIFPFMLDLGQKFVHKVNLEDIEQLKSKGVTKIKAVINDTYGNEHRSKWFNI